ncbi:hypothetical protein L2Q67_004701, partial [Salmonella enterica]|nr:hypothetical protein [Salmonella enterica]
LPEHMVHDKEYGKWKLEYTFDDGLFFQPKFYYEHTHKIDKKTGKRVEVMKAKGIPKSRVKEFMNRDKYKDLIAKTIAGEERYVLYDESVKVPVKHKPKLGTSLKNDIDPNVLVIVKKSINLRADQKRKMDYINQTSSPLQVNDEILEEADEFSQWMKEQDVRLEREKQLDMIVKMFGKIATPDKDSVWYERYKRLKPATKRKYFSKKESTSIEIYTCEVNEEFGFIRDWKAEHIFELIEDTEYFL